MNIGRAEDLTALTHAIKEQAQRLGFALVGVSPVKSPAHEESFAEWLRKGFAGEMAYMQRTEGPRRDPMKLLPWAKSVVSVGMNYQTPHKRAEGEGTKGWISRYAWGDDYHDVIKERLEKLLVIIKENYSMFGEQRPLDRLGADPSDRVVQGPEQIEGKVFTDSGPVLERALAAGSGIGWIGKNTMLISPEKGSWFFLGELFLNIELDYDRPIRDRCGSCDLCLKACPTGAFVGPYVLDARRCISYLTIELKTAIPRHLRPLMGNHIFGCDVCQEVCPYNVKAKPTEEGAYAPRQGHLAPELIPLLSLSDEEFKRRFRGSPVLRAKRRGFLRNVAVALGNLKDKEAIPALAEALDDREPLVREHAAWALGRIGTLKARGALEERLKVESEEDVRCEIRDALAAC
ncbi:MAG TPA: tRNA epoxyqueuosine(34) reductase QueG [Candidatus Binatia bacterium]